MRTPLQRTDVVVVGGGIVGLATAMALSAQHRLSVVVLEAEDRLAAHQSGRNSGVIHSGLYYPPGSMKAELCIEGRRLLIEFCRRHDIPHRRCGKLVVAIDSGEIAALERLRDNGEANGLAGLEWLDRRAIAGREPHAAGVAALWVPQTGVVDFAEVTRACAERVQDAGGRVRTGARVVGIEPAGEGLVIRTDRFALRCSLLVNCAGLYSDRVARLAGARPSCRIVPFRGEYREIVGDSAKHVRGLIYPVPDPALPFLGVHLTRTIGDRVLAGPNAVLALSRRGYRWRTLDPRDAVETALYPGFWRLARGFWRSGLAETRRSLSRRLFLRDLRRLVPSIGAADLRPAPAGVRAQLVEADGRMVHDFRIERSPAALHLLNAPSPAATASLAIGRHLAARVERQLDTR